MSDSPYQTSREKAAVAEPVTVIRHSMTEGMWASLLAMLLIGGMVAILLPDGALPLRPHLAWYEQPLQTPWRYLLPSLAVGLVGLYSYAKASRSRVEVGEGRVRVYQANELIADRSVEDYINVIVPHERDRRTKQPAMLVFGNGIWFPLPPMAFWKYNAMRKALDAEKAKLISLRGEAER